MQSGETISVEEAGDMLAVLRELDDSDAVSVSMALRLLFACYIKGTKNTGAIVFEDGESVRVLALSCGVMQATAVLERGLHMLQMYNVADAPPKEMFN